MLDKMNDLSPWQLTVTTPVHVRQRGCFQKQIVFVGMWAHRCRLDVWYSVVVISPQRHMIRVLHLSNDAILGWLTTQLTRQCFISFFRINVCLSTAAKATSQGSLTTPPFIWFIYKPRPCASLSFSTHLPVSGWSDWLSQTSTNDVCSTTAACLEHLQSNLLSSLFNVLTAKVNLTAVVSDTVQQCFDKATVEYVQDTSEILYFALDFTMSGIHSGESYTLF